MEKKMQKSRKGMRLNDAQYFRQPLPHTRKRITKFRLLPSDKITLDRPKVPKRLGYIHDQSKILDREHPSTVITWVSFANESKCNQDIEPLKKCHDIGVETLNDLEIIPTIPSSIPKVTLESDEIIKLPVEQTVDPFGCTFDHTKILKDEKPIIYEPHEIREMEKMTKIHEKNVKSMHTKHKSSWWQIIIDFFSFFFGRRESSNEKLAKKKTRTKNSHRTILVTEKLETTNIPKGLNRKNQTTVEDVRVIHNHEHRRRRRRDEKLQSRQMSCPLY